eukprot:245061-Chlamydomonas_euryale.AAC.2
MQEQCINVWPVVVARCRVLERTAAHEDAFGQRSAAAAVRQAANGFFDCVVMGCVGGLGRGGRAWHLAHAL